MSFPEQFNHLTGNPPLSWQERLYCEHFACKPAQELPRIIDLPTGLGKTRVMAIWLIAREVNEQLPRRLIYVVDRRTVVDQATDLACQLKDKAASELPGAANLAVSTLRGRLADNRDWSHDLSRPAIIIGTVDLIGSALLFSGYRSRFKRRPLEAGLLGQDSLLVLDEAHLSRPFEQLLRSIERFNKTSGDGVPSVKPMRVICMSATSATGTTTDAFRLEGDFDSGTGDFADDTVHTRYQAAKRLSISILSKKDKLTDKLADRAIELAESSSLRGKRIVVFVRRPDDAKGVAKVVREHIIESVDDSGGKPKKIKKTPYADSVEVLTGTMRGLERDQLVKKPVLKRFLDGDENPDDPANHSPVFLISTSAGEVGVDSNADHMVCDATTIESFIQRLGRVNRRGLGDAQVHLIVEPPKENKDGTAKKLEGLDLAIANTLDLFRDVQDAPDLSPKNIALLKAGKWKDRYAAACSPDIPTVELTDILLDAWSMTSIIEPMPGRPEVGPWLRGIAEWEPPQTTVAWRAELGLDGFAGLELADIEEWFDSHRILTHETLSERTSEVANWFIERWGMLPEVQQRELGNRCVVVDRSGVEVMPLSEVIARLLRKSATSDAFLRGAQIVVPASFGGIRRGLLDPAEPKFDKDDEKKSSEEQQAIDVADIAPDRIRQRKVETTIDGEKQEPIIIGSGTEPKTKSSHRVEIESDDKRTVHLVSHIPRFEKPEVGQTRQTLAEHVIAVRNATGYLLNELSLHNDVRRAVELAAEYHDHGKNRDRWQRLVNGTATVGTTAWLQQTELNGEGKHQCLGKSGSEMKRDSRGYRHEFGSLREFSDAFNAGTLLDDTGKPINEYVFDLAMHLIATHHGRGRPHFPKGGFDPEFESRSDAIHTDAIRRFARLQRRYGWWHLAWLENLLRCADAIVSRK